MNPNLNCLSYWFPKLQATGVPVPKTEIVHTTVDLISCFDGVKPDGLDPFVSELTAAAKRIGLPCFLRSGHTSAKHDWKRTCFLTDVSKLLDHVLAIVEYGEMSSLMGLPYDVWAVRELLPTEPSFIAFDGMPITMEYRYFIEDGKVTCFHPYWPELSIEEHTEEPDWKAKLALNNYIPLNEAAQLNSLSMQVSKAFEGAWSLDWLRTKNGYHAIDMAPASSSWHWPDCPMDRWHVK